MAEVTNIRGARPVSVPDWVVGPFVTYGVRLEGKRIPKLEATPLADGTINLVLDHRFCVNFPADRAHDVAWLIAQALAIGEGYPSLSAETKGRPFAPQWIEIGSVTTEQQDT